MLIFIPQRKEVYIPQAIQNLTCAVLAYRITEYTTSTGTGRLKVCFNQNPSKYQQNTLFIFKIFKEFSYRSEMIYYHSSIYPLCPEDVS